MIHIKINTVGETKSIEISGHAGYAGHGYDIVCAAVSTVFQVAILGFTHLARQYKEYIKITLGEEENE